MLTFDNLKIISTEIDEGRYDHKKGKHIKYKSPKITKKTLFDGDVYGLGELYDVMKVACQQGRGTVTMTVKLNDEY
jgi:acyl-CoA synthetase (NDP forming)